MSKVADTVARNTEVGTQADPMAATLDGFDFSLGLTAQERQEVRAICAEDPVTAAYFRQESNQSRLDDAAEAKSTKQASPIGASDEELARDLAEVAA